MTKKKLKKEVLVTANQSDLTESEFMTDSYDKIGAATDHSSIVTLDPLPAAVKTMLDGLAAKMSKKVALEQEHKSLTTEIHEGSDDVRKIFARQWAVQIETAIGDDYSQAQLFKFGIKNVDNGKTDNPLATAANSLPVITRILNDVEMQHTIFFLNSLTGNVAIPDGGDHIDVYEWTGEGMPPRDLKKLTYLGVAKYGKFVNIFAPDDKGKTIWYIAVYVSKKTKTANQLSVAESSIVF